MGAIWLMDISWSIGYEEHPNGPEDTNAKEVIGSNDYVCTADRMNQLPLWEKLRTITTAQE